MTHVLTRAGTELRVARSVEELEALREPWRALQGDHYATDPEIFPRILEWQPHAVRPHVVVLERDGAPRAVVVARIEDIALTTKVGYKAVYSPRVRALTVVYRGVLGEPSEEDALLVLDELRSALRNGEADVLRLRHAEVGSPLHRAVRAVPRRVLRERAGPTSIHWALVVPESYEAFLRSLSRSTRESAKRYPKKLERELGDRLELRTYRDPADLERVLADARTVSAKTYQHGLGVAFGQTELQRQLAALFMERGWFRALFLYLDGEPIAFWQGHAYRGTFTTGVPGFDPAYGDLRVGNYVLFKLIAELCEDETVQTLDYGFGDAEYKRRFGSRSWLEQNLHVFAPTFKGVRTNVLRSSTLGAVALAGRGLRSDRVDRIKRSWRDRLTPG